MAKTPLVEMINITKRFPGVLANDQVNLAVSAGEIHALLGENGAGKSTLMSILTGLYQPEQGEIRIKGEPVRLTSPREAMSKGIGMVHQHFKLVKPFTVAENILLGLPGLKQLYSLAEIHERINNFCQEYGLDIDPEAKIWQLSVGEQQRAEIIKILFRGADILIMDEPTAVLTPQEAEDLYGTLRKMANQGKAIIVISHKLNEVLDHTDEITVLRGGKVTGTVSTKESDELALTRMMVGRSVMMDSCKAACCLGSNILELKGVTALDNRGQRALKGIDLNICEGEILGIAGVAGNGQKELAEVIAGLRPIENGKKFVKGKEHTKSNPRTMVEVGVSYVPEDRLGNGLVGNLSAVENFILKSYSQYKGLFINWKQARRGTEEVVKQFDVKIANLNDPVKMLSGGNLQKLLLGREITAHPSLIICVYPMRGLDVGAIEAVRKVLLAQRQDGKAILLISEELDELFSLSDRIAVLHEGEIMGVVKPEETSIETVGMMMAGKKVEHAIC